MITHSRLLMDEPPIVVSRSLAKKVGLNEAIFLQQIHYWVQINTQARRNFLKGRYWTYNSQPELVAFFGIWSLSTIQRMIRGLREQGVLLAVQPSGNKQDTTTWYSIDYEKLNAILDTEESSGHGPGSDTSTTLRETATSASQPASNPPVNLTSDPPVTLNTPHVKMNTPPPVSLTPPSPVILNTPLSNPPVNLKGPNIQRVTKYTEIQNTEKPNREDTPCSPPQGAAPGGAEIDEPPAGVMLPSRGRSERERATREIAPYQAEFDAFWQAYPPSAKGSKPRAMLRYAEQRRAGATHEAIMQGLTRWCNSQQWSDARYIKHAEGWLNGEFYTQSPVQKVGSKFQQRCDQTVELMKRMGLWEGGATHAIA